MFFDGGRNLHRSGWIVRLAMRHRQHSHKRFTVLLAFDRERDDAGAIFAPFFLPTLRFLIP